MHIPPLSQNVQKTPFVMVFLDTQTTVSSKLQIAFPLSRHGLTKQLYVFRLFIKYRRFVLYFGGLINR